MSLHCENMAWNPIIRSYKDVTVPSSYLIPLTGGMAAPALCIGDLIKYKKKKRLSHFFLASRGFLVEGQTQLRVDDTHFEQQSSTSLAYRLTPKTRKRKKKNRICVPV